MLKKLLRMFKGPIKAIIIGAMKSNEDKIVSYVLEKVKLPMSGEQEELILKTLYDAIETVVANSIESI